MMRCVVFCCIVSSRGVICCAVIVFVCAVKCHVVLWNTVLCCVVSCRVVFWCEICCVVIVFVFVL